MKKMLLVLVLAFCGISGFAQTQKVEVVSSSPANGAEAVEQDSIVLEFNIPIYIEDLENPEFSGLDFFVEPEDSVSYDSLALSNDGLKLTIYLQLADDTDYISGLLNVEGESGEPLATPYFFQFTTADQAGEFTVEGALQEETLDKLKAASHSYNGFVVILSSAEPDLGIEFFGDFEEEEDTSDAEGGDIVPVYAATVDTLTGEYSISGVREGIYYPVAFNVSAIDFEEEGSAFFFPDIYFYDPNEDFEVDSIEVNTTTTAPNDTLSGVNLRLLDFSPVTFSEAVQEAENLLSELDNNPVVMGGATFYSYFFDFEVPDSDTMPDMAFGLKRPEINFKKLPVRQRKTSLQEDHNDFEFLTTPNGYHLIWSIFAYDDVKDSVIAILSTPFGAEILEYIGPEEAELPEGVEFSSIKPLPDTYIDSDSAASIAENEGGADFRAMFESDGDGFGYWDVQLQALHEYWLYPPDPTPDAPVFWRAVYYGSGYDSMNDEYFESYMEIFIDIQSGDVLHKFVLDSTGSGLIPMTFADAVDSAKTHLELLENDPVLVGGFTFYTYSPDYEDDFEKRSKARKAKKSFINASREPVFMPSPDGYHTNWDIIAYDAVKDSALGFFIDSDGVHFYGYIGIEDAELPEGVGFSDFKTLPESFIDSDSAVAIMEAEGGADFRAAFEVNNETEAGYWDLEIQALHEFWNFEPDPTPGGAPVMWKGDYYGNLYNFETEEFTTDFLTIFLDIETGDVLFKSPTSREYNSEVPETIRLHQNYPNPFNPSTNITFELNRASRVELSVYNLIGQKVATLASDRFPAGSHTVKWNAAGMASGMYFYRLSAGNTVQTKKLMLIK